MNNFIKQIINEKFASKKQQRLFYAKASDSSLPKKEREKWKERAKEFSSKTDFSKIPEKVEKEVDEIVDEKGAIKRGKKPANLATKGISQKSITDKVVKTSAGSMGAIGVHGTHTSLRYWAEADMSKILGYKETLGKDESMDAAEKHFEDDLDLPKDETDDRLKSMGYDENLDDGQVRLVENPKKFIEEFIESVLNQKSKDKDIVNKNSGDIKEVSPIMKRQIKSFNETLKSHNMSINDVLEFFQDNE